MTDPTIVVVAKSPVPGRVKTRLCPPCTPAQAAHLAAALLADTLSAVAGTPATARVLALDGPPGPWIPDGFVIVPQIGRALDERLANAFAAVTGPALLIGMDTPQVSREDLTRATRALLRPGVDAVLGPTIDGGWWAIGLRDADPRVFAGVPMSTHHTGRDQRERLDALGYRTTMLDTVRDIDTFLDAIEVARTVPTSRLAAALTDLANTETAAG